MKAVPPSGGSLEIGNGIVAAAAILDFLVPPSGGSLEIGNNLCLNNLGYKPLFSSPFGGIPRNWKPFMVNLSLNRDKTSSPFGGIPRNWKLPRAYRTSLASLSSPFGGIPRNWKLGLLHPRR